MTEVVSPGRMAPSAPVARRAAIAVSTRALNNVLGAVFLCLILYFAVSAPSFENFLCAFLVTAVSLLPALLWANGYVGGIPCFPLFTMLYIFYFGVPFAIGHPAVETYSAAEKLTASFTVAGYLLLATVVWTVIAKTRAKGGERCLIFDPHANVHRYLILLVLATLFNLNAVSGLIFLPGDVAGLIRPFILGLGVIGIFLMAYNYGAKALNRIQSLLFLLLLVLFVLSQASSLLLISAYMSVGSALVGYWLSTRRLSIWVLVLGLLFLVVFQAGKYEMRRTYLEDGYIAMQPHEYPAFFGNWLIFGFNAIASNLTEDSTKMVVDEDRDSISVLTRASLAHMLLLVQAESPASVPYLGGDTYSGIPALLLPRLLFPDKGSISDPMYRLSIAYAVLPIDSEGTSIAWGLLPEAFANFGYSGTIALGLVMGAFFGLFARLCAGYSVFAMRSIASIMLVTTMLGFESHAAAAAATVFQSLVAVVLASLLFARISRNPGSEF